MITHIIIPWHDNNDPHRAAALRWVQHRWATEFPDWPISLGVLSDDSDWCKADAVHIAIEHAEPDDSDLLVITDADVWTDPDDINLAAHQLDHGHAEWAMPHSHVHRLNETATRHVLETNLDPAAAVKRYGYDRSPYLGTVGGGTTILTAANYQQCPLDPRFVGWGQEDEAWGDALRTVLGHRHRGNGNLHHLWHPPLPRMAPGIGNIQSKHLRDSYRRHTGDIDGIIRLIDSGRPHLIT